MGRFHQLRRDREPRGLPRHVEAGRDDFLPDPSGDPATSRSSRSTTTSSSRPTCSRAGSRRGSPTPRRVSRPTTTAWSTGSTTGSGTTRSGSTRSSAGRSSERSFEPDPLRRDAARRVGHRRPRRTTWTSTACTRRSASRRRSPASPGQRYQLGVSDPELALAAVVRAANDWHLEEWARHVPRADHPVQLPWLLDPELGAAEIRRNAARGLPRGDVPRAARAARPAVAAHRLLGSVHRRRARRPGRSCACTSARRRPSPTTSSDAPPDTIGVLFFGWAMFAAVDWLYSKIPVRFPDLRICLSEGGIGWVAGLLDRLDHVARYQRDVRHVGRHRADAARGDAAQLLVLRHRRPAGARAAPPHRHRPHPARVRLPAPGRHVARHPGDRCARRSAASPPTTSSASRGGTRRSCSTTRCPTCCSATPTPTCGPSEGDESMYERDRLYIGGAWVARSTTVASTW